MQKIESLTKEAPDYLDSPEAAELFAAHSLYTHAQIRTVLQENPFAYVLKAEKKFSS